MLQMVADQLTPDASQGLVHGCDLREDVGAVAFLLHHSLQPANLSLDPPQTLQIPLPGRRIDSYRVSFSVPFGPGVVIVMGFVGHLYFDGPPPAAEPWVMGSDRCVLEQRVESASDPRPPPV